jgi:hypothetical protein
MAWRRIFVEMRALTLILAVIFLTGCGGTATDQAGPTSPPASQPRPPITPKPTLTGFSSRPPAAWLETEAGSFWLGYSSYCWTTACVDFVAPSCGDTEHTPKITVRREELVTVHLGFEPTELALHYLSGNQIPRAEDQRTLELSRSPTWRAERDGPFSLFVRGKGGDASYVACFQFK